MALARRVGLGLASRGKVSDCVSWAERARAAGLESVWFHDSYFERDAVTYASAVASQVEDIAIGLGALNPFTRHPVLIAMTVSALDEMAPSRIRLGLGSALPLRLWQMGIPYSPDEAATRTTTTIDTLHQLWSGERIPSGKQGLPPIQPMFPPVHRVPIYIAGYRSPMMVVAGQKGDGYLARPAESIPGLRKLLRVMDRAAREAGREPDAIDVAGYLLTFIDETRRDALNRAKRDPFVIYMMSILSDVTLRRAGFEPENRDRIATKWRAEDYTGAGALIADELLDAYILCGPRRAAVLVHRVHGSRGGGWGARGPRRRVRSVAVPRHARRRGGAARRHERDERDLRRAEGRRHDRLTARQPRDRQGTSQRAGRVPLRDRRVCGRGARRPLPNECARLADRRAWHRRARRRVYLHGEIGRAVG